MTILAEISQKGQSLKVEVTSTFTTGDGRKLASVQTIDGAEAFTSWTHGGWCSSSSARVPVSSLKNIVADSEPEASNLLSMALAYSDKRQWHSGEVVYIWGDHKRGGAFLKEEDGFVRLSITHYPHSCLIYWLGLDGWAVSESLTKNYQTWATRAAEVLSK